MKNSQKAQKVGKTHNIDFHFVGDHIIYNNIKISRRTFESSDLANYTINQGKPMLF